MTSAGSPLRESEHRGFGFLGVMLLSLTLILSVAAVLIWTIDEQPGQAGRGLLLLGLALFALTLALLVRRLARRGGTVAVAEEERAATLDDTATSWRRLRLGPPWTDWLAFLVPVVLIGLPLFFAAGQQTLETALAIGGIVGVIELIVLPGIISARREPVAIALVPEGVLVTRRSGRTHLIRQGSLACVRLEVQTVRGSSFGRMALEIEGSKPLVFREPMNAPLPGIAQRVAAHAACDLVR